MSVLPRLVIQCGEWLAHNPDHELHEIGSKLITDSPDIAGMWRAVKRHNPHENRFYPAEYIYLFLSDANRSSKLPAHEYLPTRRRKELVEEIQALTDKLSQLIQEHELDHHLIHVHGHIFNGVYVYEGFGEINQSRIDDDPDTLSSKITLSRILTTSAKYMSGLLLDDMPSGKASRNVRAIRYIRSMARQIHPEIPRYSNMVLSVSANAIFDTTYTESDIAKTLNR